MPDSLKAIKKIDKIADELAGRGIYLPEGYKRRDPKEPGRAEKELAEVKLTRLIKRLFAGQKKRIREWLELQFPSRKQAKPPEPPEDVFEDEEIKALIIALFLAAVFAGIDLAATDADDLFDLLETKNLSIDFVRAYTTQWLLDLNATTREALLKALQLFMETPGMTMADLMALLPFEEHRLLRIATTEITRMYAVGVQLAGEQLARDFPGVRVIKTWFTNRDEIVCERCEPLNGVSVKIKDNFINGVGLPAFHPPDHVNCILPGNKVSVPGRIAAATQAFYNGIAIELSFYSGRKISVTENHMILGKEGWACAKDFNQFDYVMGASNGEGISSTINPNNYNAPTLIEKVFTSLHMSNEMLTRRMPTTPIDFHGDGKFINGDIYIVYPHSFLGSNPIGSKIYLPVTQQRHKMSFGSNAMQFPVSFSSFSPGNLRGHRVFSSSGSIMGRLHLGSLLSISHQRPFHSFSLGLCSKCNALISQYPSHSITPNTILARQFVDRFSGDIFLDQIRSIREYDFSDHVYDLQVEPYSLYFTNGIITHNCRCWMSASTDINKSVELQKKP